MTAPAFRSIDQLSGEQASSKFFAALADADAQAAELEALRAENARLRRRNTELSAALGSMCEELSFYHEQGLECVGRGGGNAAGGDTQPPCSGVAVEAHLQDQPPGAVETCCLATHPVYAEIQDRYSAGQT